MFILDPDFYPSQIPDLWLSYSFVATNIKKFVNSFIFEQVKKFFSQNTKKHVIETQTIPKKLLLSYQRYGFGIQDPESGKTYSGSRIQGQKGSGSRIRIRNTA